MRLLDSYFKKWFSVYTTHISPEECRRVIVIFYFLKSYCTWIVVLNYSFVLQISMPALDPSCTMMEAVVVDVERNISTGVKPEQENNNNNTSNNNNNNGSRDVNGETGKYPESSNNGYSHSPTSSNGYNSPSSVRSVYDEVLPPIYMSTMSVQQSSQPSYKPYATDNDSVKYTNSGSTHSSDFHRPYQASPPNIDKAPSFVVRQLSESKSNTPPSPSSTPPDDKHVWSKSEIELLLDLYETYKDQLKDPRVRKTKVWDDVARIIREKLDSDVTGCQCNQKFRNLKADFQKVLDHNGRPGNFKRVCKYYDRLANILSYQGQPPRGYPGPHPGYPPLDMHDNGMARIPKHREIYYDNGRTSSSPKPPLKRKMSQDSMMLNGLSNGHHDMYFMDKKQKTSCSCECAHEVTTLRDTVERINNYIIARSAHEEERMRRMEEMHREKLVALSRFVDIFKDFVLKMT